LSYIGFGGAGHQVRDCIHASDLARLVATQMKTTDKSKPRICNVGGGIENSISLRQLSDWCEQRFGPHKIDSIREDRVADVPWAVMDSSLAKKTWGFEASVSLHSILEEIVAHNTKHPDWLQVSAQ